MTHLQPSVSGTLADDLRAARALIADRAHWMQGNLANRENTCFCTFGAAQYGPQSKWSKGEDTPATLALIDALPEPFRSGPSVKHRLAMFNDDPATTHNDVLALFDRAIKQAETSP